MKKQLGIIGWSVLIFALLNGCTKENGKHEYTLRLEFSSGDIWETSTIMHEKTENIFDKGSYKASKNAVYLDFKYVFYLLKVDNRIFTGVNSMELDITNLSMFNGLSVNAQARIEMEGEYTRKMKQYIVENGTFKMKFSHYLYNLPDSIYTGKWTLKRK